MTYLFLLFGNEKVCKSVPYDFCNSGRDSVSFVLCSHVEIVCDHHGGCSNPGDANKV